MQLVDFIICDDIRFELKNKISIIGIYNEALNIEANNPEQIPWPLSVPVGIYMRFTYDEEDQLAQGSTIPFTFSATKKSDQEEEVLARLTGQYTHNNPESHYICIPIRTSLQMKGPGVLLFSLTLNQQTFVAPDFEIRVKKK